MGSRIAELAGAILSNTTKIQEYLRSNELPFPSFDEDAPIDLKLPPDLNDARIKALEASIELQDLLQGPDQLLLPVV